MAYLVLLSAQIADTFAQGEIGMRFAASPSSLAAAFPDQFSTNMPQIELSAALLTVSSTF